MKKQILSVVVTLSVIITLSVAVLAGLSRNLKATIPFDFMVNGKTLPAGEYVVEQGSNHHVLVIRSWKTRQAAASITMECKANADGKPRLIFNRYGDQYFLAKVLSPTGGNELVKSKAEREAARAKRDHLAMKDAAPEIVTVSAEFGQ